MAEHPEYNTDGDRVPSMIIVTNTCDEENVAPSVQQCPSTDTAALCRLQASHTAHQLPGPSRHVPWQIRDLNLLWPGHIEYLHLPVAGASGESLAVVIQLGVVLTGTKKQRGFKTHQRVHRTQADCTH